MREGASPSASLRAADLLQAHSAEVGLRVLDRCYELSTCRDEVR